MAYTLIGSVIRTLAPYVQEEYATFKGVNKHAEKLSRNLTAIHAVLKDAEEKQITSHAVKVWLENLTDAAHILDDILDKCSIVSESNRDDVSIFHLKKLYARRGIGKKMKEVAEKIDAIAEERIKFGLQSGNVERHLEDDEWRQTTSFITEPQILGRNEDKEKVVEFLLRHAIDKEGLSVYSIVGHGGYGKTALAQLVFNDERVNTHFPLKIWVCVSDDFSMMKILQSIVESKDGKNPNLSTLQAMQEKVQTILQNKRYLLVLDDVWNEDQHKWDKFMSFLQCGNGTKGASVLVTTRLDTVVSTVKTVGESPIDDNSVHRLVGLSDDSIWSLFKQHAFGAEREERADLVTIGKEIVRKCVGSPLAAKVLGSLLRFKTEECQWLSIKESEIWNLSDNKIISALNLSYYNLKLSLKPCFTFCAVFPKDFVMVKEDVIHLWMANGFISSRGNLEMEEVGNEVWNELYQRSFFQEVETHEEGKVTFKMHDIFHDVASSILGEQCVTSKADTLTNLSKRVHHISFFNIDEQFKFSLIPFKKVESLRTFLDFFPPESNLGVFPSITPLRALRTSSSQLSALKNLIHLRYLELYESDTETLPESICSLRKLQTLKLECCYNLYSLPNKLTQLQDLRHLVIKECHSLSSMPFKIGGLTHLRTLSIFIVRSEAGFGLAELHNLELRGKLHIKGLENVTNERDAREAKLIGKELSRLYLSWSGTNSQCSVTGAEQVLEALEPHTGLKCFGMKGYGGINIPKLDEKYFYFRRRLPPLGKLPCLTTLYVYAMRDVKYIDDDMYEGATKKAFPSLKKMTLHDLPNLERVLKAEGVEMLSQLSDLTINGNSKLAFPSLRSVKFLSAIGETDFNDDGASFLRGFAASMNNLEELFIENFDELKVLPNELNSLSSLQELIIRSCPKLESVPECVLQGLSSLRVLSFTYCKSLISLPQSTINLTCLETLQIAYCPNLVLPANMNMLSSLREVRIFGEDKNGTLPNGLEGIPCLQNLQLYDCSSLASLPQWLGAMTSLQTLEIKWFPMLTSLPDSFQELINLKELRISNCPMLMNRCKKETGEDWHKIAHIPRLKLEFDVEPSFKEKITSLWKLSKKQFWRRHKDYFPFDAFDQMVDEL
ncbi:disease resistance protein (CC-NBS-LRR class) family protein [Medicago truncatula]|uniref:Disease resistance protein (CC-NBS-LRR class) family protein n=1 Tax=Medicago truncatula TaxID=3880 RepID=G7KKK6_MEDTR|nr:disease resistance protein (CC-NBS-LRR class) family protein [Medicago truncatula]